MDKKPELLKHENLNEESVLKRPPINKSFQEPLNKSTNNASNTQAGDIQSGLKNINFKLEDLNIEQKEDSLNIRNAQNISKVSVTTQYKLYIPFAVIKISLPAFLLSKYLVYSISNEEDQIYCKYSTCILAMYILFCYFLSVFSKSSQTNINKYYTQDVYIFKPGSPGSEIQDLNLLDWGECPFCRTKKFMRVSHCRICNKCILMRDHHCPYVANCIGFKNIQYFFNFVLSANIGNIYYISIFIYYMFVSDVKKNMHFLIYIISYVDLFFNFFFIININGILLNLFIVVYNNWTQKEILKGPPTENYCPIHSCGVNDGKKLEEKRDVNFYNIGFLTHFYHLIGPTILHSLFPLPKYKNYNIDENCPIFKRVCLPNRFELFRYMVRKDPSKMELLNGGDVTPENYLKLCHQYYEGKNII